MGEQAELLAPRQHLCRKTCGDAEQADRNRHRLQPVRDRKAAVEDAQRGGADLAGRGELEQRAVEPELGRECPQLLLQACAVGAGLQPQREVVDAGVAGDALVVVARHRDRAALARVVTPDTAHEHERAAIGAALGTVLGAARQRQREARAGPGAVEVDHGLADVDRRCAAPGRDQFTDQRQVLPGLGQRARDQHHGGLRGIELQGHHPLRLGTHDALELRRAQRHRGGQRDDLADADRRGRAHIEIGRQHGVEPLRDRIAKARDHHGECDRQAQTRDHAGDSDRRGVALVACAFHRQQRERMARRRDAFQQQRHAGRHAGDAAEQQAGHSHVSGQRNAADGRQQRQPHAADDQCRPEPRCAADGAGCAQALQRLGRRKPLRIARRQPAADDRREHAEPAIHRCRARVELQGRCHPRKVAAAEIAREQAQRERRECGAERQPECAADRTEQRRLGQHEREPLTCR